MAKGMTGSVYLDTPDGTYLAIHYVSYSQTNPSTMIGSPSEDGITFFDNRVIMPIRVQFTGIVLKEDFDVFNGLRASFKNNKIDKLICTFHTRTGTIKNMVIENLEEIGESNRYDGLEIKGTLQEFLVHNKG